MPSLTVLSCPVCGAPLAPEPSRCDYCGSVVVIHTDHPRINPHQLNRAVIDEHIARYRTAVRRDSNDETAHYGLGVAYFNLGLLEEAAEELTRSARLMPENPHIQTQLAVVYADLAKAGKRGAEQSAWDRVNRALLLRPTLTEALLLKANLHLRRRQWQQAVECWRQIPAEQVNLVREPVVRFLDAHRDVLLNAPELVGYAAEVEPATATAGGWQWFRWYKQLAVVSFVFFFILWIGLAGTSNSAVPFLGMLIVPFAVWKLGQKQLRHHGVMARASRKAAQAARRVELQGRVQEFLTGKGVDVAQYLTAAEYTASELARDGQQEPTLPSTTNKAPSSISRSPQPGTWELCEIVARTKFPRGVLFAAEVVGPRGRYQADHKVVGGPYPPKRNTRQHVQKMVDQLLATGWELQPMGSEWWSYRFRRQAPSMEIGPRPAVGGTFPPRKSGEAALALWLILGLIGGHRYYLGHRRTAVLQTVTIGGLGLWWLLDQILLPGLIRKANDAL